MSWLCLQVAAMFVGIMILGVQFVTEHKMQRLTDGIATYITVLTGAWLQRKRLQLVRLMPTRDVQDMLIGISRQR